MKTACGLLFLILISITLIDAQPSEISADNGTLKVKFDLTRGGVISYISLSGRQRNLVNVWDEGRYIQQSYYAGKAVDRKVEGQSPKWSPWPWNPIQVGDYYRNRAQILDYKQKDDTLYVKCIPMLWDMNNKPAEAELEQQTILIGNILKVHCKLTCHRTDSIYSEGDLDNQELPAVYPISSLSNLYCYLGKKPFTNDTISNLSVHNLKNGNWGYYSDVMEHWMAFVDSTNWGMGVYNPRCTDFAAGMYSMPGKESKDDPTSYIAPLKKEVLNKNSVYEYDYYIIIGSLQEIREKVYKLNKKSF
jgi:hypothetical protein